MPIGPALFGSEMGRSGALFISAWVQQLRRPGLTEIILWDAFEHLDPADRGWWREDREKRFGRLEAYKDGPEAKAVAWRQRLEPLRVTLAEQPFLGGDSPGYADYVVFGEFPMGPLHQSGRIDQSGRSDLRVARARPRPIRRICACDPCGLGVAFDFQRKSPWP